MAIKLSALEINVDKVFDEGVSLIDNPRVYDEYREGVNVGPGGIVYPCLVKGLNYEKQNVKVPGNTVAVVEYNGNPVPLEFEGLKGKLWQDFNNHGEIKLSVTATAVKLPEKRKITINSDKG